jgi:hypothetical protein
VAEGPDPPGRTASAAAARPHTLLDVALDAAWLAILASAATPWTWRAATPSGRAPMRRPTQPTSRPETAAIVPEHKTL